MFMIYLYCILIAALAVVYCEVLTAPGMILAWLDKAIHKVIRAEWLLKPFGDCALCFGGQLALWGYFVVKTEYDFVEHILFVGFTIFLIHIYTKIWN